MTDPKDIKAGDWAHVRVKVSQVYGDGSFMAIPAGQSQPSDYRAYGKESVVHVETRPIAVGDKVRYIYGETIWNSTNVWRVIFADADVLWLKSGDDYSTARRAVVVRA